MLQWVISDVFGILEDGILAQSQWRIQGLFSLCSVLYDLGLFDLLLYGCTKINGWVTCCVKTPATCGFSRGTVRARVVLPHNLLGLY